METSRLKGRGLFTGELRRGDRGLQAPPGADLQAVPALSGGGGILHQVPEPAAPHGAADPPAPPQQGRGQGLRQGGVDLQNTHLYLLFCHC